MQHTHYHLNATNQYFLTNKITKKKNQNKAIPTSIKNMNIIGLAVVLAITTKNIEQPPTPDRIAGVPPPPAGPCRIPSLLSRPLRHVRRRHPLPPHPLKKHRTKPSKMQTLPPPNNTGHVRTSAEQEMNKFGDDEGGRRLEVGVEVEVEVDGGRSGGGD